MIFQILGHIEFEFLGRSKFLEPVEVKVTPRGGVLTIIEIGEG